MLLYVFIFGSMHMQQDVCAILSSIATFPLSRTPAFVENQQI